MAKSWAGRYTVDQLTATSYGTSPRRPPHRRQAHRARAPGGLDRYPDAGSGGSLRRAANLGDGSRRLVPGVLDLAPPRRRSAAGDRIRPHLRLVQRVLPAAMGASVSV